MTTKRRATSRRATKRATSKRATSKRASGRRTTRATPRRRPATATTLGAAAGTVAVAFLFGAPWSVRIALIVLLVGGAGAALFWSRRS